MRVGKSLRFGDLARLGLGERAERQNGARKLLLRQRPEHVALVLFFIRAAAQQPAPGGRAAFYDGVMARSDVAHAQALREFEKFSELHRPVALYARVRREPSAVCLYEWLYDVFAEFGFERKDVERYAEARGYLARGLFLRALGEQPHDGPGAFVRALLY